MLSLITEITNMCVLLTSAAKFNHRNHKHVCTVYECIQEHLFQCLPDDQSFYSKVTAGASSMKKKLSAYAMDFLPDGLY